MATPVLPSRVLDYRARHGLVRVVAPGSRKASAPETTVDPPARNRPEHRMVLAGWAWILLSLLAVILVGATVMIARLTPLGS